MQKTKKMKKGGTLFTKDFILLICVSLITAFGYSMMSSLVSSYTLQMGAGVTLAGVASGIFSLAALISRPFSGYHAGRLSRPRGYDRHRAYHGLARGSAHQPPPIQ